MMTVQFVEIAGQRLAVLPEAEYRSLLDAAEEGADIESAIRAEERRKAGEEYVPHALVEQLINGENPLRVWRSYRGLSQSALAEKAGLSENVILELETGQRDIGSRDWRRLAEALDVDLDDLIPLD
jgi:ribosome-binding protein aMBF1 (putative translation factor)